MIVYLENPKVSTRKLLCQRNIVASQNTRSIYRNEVYFYAIINNSKMKFLKIPFINIPRNLKTLQKNFIKRCTRSQH